MTIKIVRDDICNIKADVIVNAANETLEGGGGVDYCIHKNAGLELLTECRKYPLKNLTLSTVVDFGRCDVGEVKVTPSFLIKKCSYIFHTVAPILDKNGNPNDKHLELCYINCLDMMYKLNMKSIVFCCIGTGFYGFPKEKAALIAIETAIKYPNIDIIFSIVDDIDYNIYSKLLHHYK